MLSVCFMRVKLVFSPSRKELHRSDMELLSVRDVLSVGELHGSPHGAGETLIHASRARRRRQLQAGADHVTHDCETKIENLSPSKHVRNADWISIISCNQRKPILYWLNSRRLQLIRVLVHHKHMNNRGPVDNSTNVN